MSVLNIVPLSKLSIDPMATAVQETSQDAIANGEVVIGDLSYDGRVILYIIKGQTAPRSCGEIINSLPTYQPTKPLTSITSSP